MADNGGEETPGRRPASVGGEDTPGRRPAGVGGEDTPDAPVAISVEGLGKRYRLGTRSSYRRLSESLTRGALKLVRRTRAQRQGDSDLLWVLKDASFTVREGEIVGVVGRNGAGKTTLLKILSRITRPTEGRAEIRGRVGSMLEVGTGFHPELTGRENVFLNGAILGMTRGEITSRYDDIVAFSELARFMNTPVKHFSSGMYVRLAFAVAAHLEPEILLVDEVLAVGDASFQRKCLGKMEEVADRGRTVLFVSHNMGVVTQLCGRALWLDEGRLRMDGGPREVVQAYLSEGAEESLRWEHPPDLGCGRKARVESLELASDAPLDRPTVPFDRPIRILLTSEVREATAQLVMGVRVTDATGAVVFTSWDTDTLDVGGVVRERGRYRSVCTIPPGLLRPGRYWITAFAHLPTGGMADKHENILVLEVSEVGYRLNAERRGIITPVLEWSMEQLT